MMVLKMLVTTMALLVGGMLGMLMTIAVHYFVPITPQFLNTNMLGFACVFGFSVAKLCGLI
jgi:hypothetical protein